MKTRKPDRNPEEPSNYQEKNGRTRKFHKFPKTIIYQNTHEWVDGREEEEEQKRRKSRRKKKTAPTSPWTGTTMRCR
jgi:hypothetical protein